MSGEAIIPYQPNTACLLVKAELACWNPEPKVPRDICRETREEFLFAPGGSGISRSFP